MGQLSKLETLRDSYEGNNPCLLNSKETSAFNERGSRSTMKLLQIKIILSKFLATASFVSMKLYLNR